MNEEMNEDCVKSVDDDCCSDCGTKLKYAPSVTMTHMSAAEIGHLITSRITALNNYNLAVHLQADRCVHSMNKNPTNPTELPSDPHVSHLIDTIDIREEMACLMFDYVDNCLREIEEDIDTIVMCNAENTSR